MRRGTDAIHGSFMPPDLAAERGAVLHRALRDLPMELLEPLLRGIRRHSDSLLPGSLHRGDGGCAVAMMLRELDGHRRRWRRRRRSNTIWEERPELARKHPRLGHIELIFDRTCRFLLERHDLPEEDVARVVGLWMAAEAQAEINLRHLEAASGADGAHHGQDLDPELLADTVARLRDMRPWLSAEEAARAVGAWVASDEPMFVPREWEDEVELQRRRLEASAEAVPS